MSTLITQQIPNNFNILDIGCGDGKISKMIIEKEKTITISGIDVFARETCAIPLKLFDGKTIPFADNEYDASILVDVLHHTNNIKDLLSEACRVSRQYVILKDHHYKNVLDFGILCFMDWIGNKPYKVKSIYNYKNLDFWETTFNELGFEIVTLNKRIPIYPFPFNLIFGRYLHFIVVLKKK